MGWEIQINTTIESTSLGLSVGSVAALIILCFVCFGFCSGFCFCVGFGFCSGFSFGDLLCFFCLVFIYYNIDYI